MKEKTSHAMGLDKDKIALDEEKKAHEASKAKLTDATKRVAALEEAIKKLRGELATTQAARGEIQKTLDAIAAEKAAESKAEEEKKVAEAKAAMEKLKMAEADKELALRNIQLVYEACSKMIGCDDDKMVAAICPTRFGVLTNMRTMYLSNFGHDMYTKVRGKTSGHYRDLLLGLLDGPVEHLVQLIYDATRTPVNESILIETIVPLTNKEMTELKESYAKLHKNSLEKDLTASVGGDLKKLFVAVLQAKRDEATAVDDKAVAADAEALYAAAEAKVIGADAVPFIAVLATRSAAHLVALEEKYKTLSKHGYGLSMALDKQFSGDVRDAFTAIFEAQTNRPYYYAHLIHESVSGLLTINQSPIVRTVALRREKDLKAIAEVYDKAFSNEKEKKLIDRMMSDLSGDLQKAVVTVLSSV